MHAYKLDTTVTYDGKIILPDNLKGLFNHSVELILIDKSKEKDDSTEFGTYNFGKKLDSINIRDFAHED